MIDQIKNSQKLEQIILNLVDVLRINLLIVDIKGQPILTPQKTGYGFHGVTQWGILQHLGKSTFLSKFQAEGSYLKSIDTFGFHCYAIPIALEGLKPIGHIIIGPVVLNKQFELSRYQKIAQDLDIDYIEFEQTLNEIRVLTFNSLKSILDLIHELSKYAFRLEVSKKQRIPKVQNIAPIKHAVYSTLLDLSMALTQAECGSILLLDKNTNELNIQAFKGIDLQKVLNAPIKLGEGIAGLAAERQESYVIRDGKTNNRIQHLLKKPELRCSLILPIINSQKEVLGVMNISTHEGKSRLASNSQEMLKNLMEITEKVVTGNIF